MLAAKEYSALFSFIVKRVLENGAALPKELEVDGDEISVTWYTAANMAAHYTLHGMCGQQARCKCPWCTVEIDANSGGSRLSPHQPDLRTEANMEVRHKSNELIVLPYKNKLQQLTDGVRKVLETAYQCVMPVLNRKKGTVIPMDKVTTTDMLAHLQKAVEAPQGCILDGCTSARVEELLREQTRERSCACMCA